jgi:hypothetical protein
MKATETGSDVGLIVTAKQKLRDAPADPRIDEAQDDAALVTALDAILGEMTQIYEQAVAA